MLVCKNAIQWFNSQPIVPIGNLKGWKLNHWQYTLRQNLFVFLLLSLA